MKSAKKATARRVLLIQVTDPAAYPPLMNAARIMADADWEATFLSSPIAGMRLALPAHPRIQLHSGPTRADFTISPLAYFDYCKRALGLARELRPSLIYASDPIGALPGLLAAKASGARLIYHEHDSPSNHRRLNPLFRYGRKAAARSAFRVVFPNADRAAAARADLGFDAERLRVLWNMPLRAELPSLPTRSEKLIVYYHGSITLDRLPPQVVAAVHRMGSRALLRIAGYETASGRGYIASLEEQFGVAAAGGVIDYIGQVSREGLLQAAAKAHLGLALMPLDSNDINMRHMAGASNKAFDYMAAGLALLVSDLPDWNAMFVAPGYGLSCDPGNEEALAQRLRWFLDHPAERADMAARARQKIEADWNYDMAFAPLLAELAGG